MKIRITLCKMLFYLLFIINSQFVSLKRFTTPLTFTALQTSSVIIITKVFFNSDGIKQIQPLKDLFLQTQMRKNKLTRSWLSWSVNFQLYDITS